MAKKESGLSSPFSRTYYPATLLFSKYSVRGDFALFSRGHDLLRTYLPGAKTQIFFPSCTVHGIKSQDFHVRSQSILFYRGTSSTSFRIRVTLAVHVGCMFCLVSL